MTPICRAFGFILVILAALCPYARGWTTLAKGLEYRAGIFSSGTPDDGFEYCALRVSLKALQVRVIDSRDCCGGPAAVKAMARATGAMAVINGGFFDEHTSPLGLVISDRRERNPLKPISWWGVFFLQQGRPSIVLTKQFEPKGRIDQALQCGPRLLADGRVPSRLKRQVVRRSAVASDAWGRIILICTKDSKVSATELGGFLGLSESEGGLGCRDALNLDGGPSSQFYLKVGENVIHDQGGQPAVNGIGVFKKTSSTGGL